MNVMLLSSAAVVAAVPTAAIAIDDPIFAAIEDHRRKYEALETVVERQSALERALPPDKRIAYSVFDRGTDVGANDDPRWTEYQDEYWAAVDAEDDTEIALLNIRPTTSMGVAALLRHAYEHENIRGAEWLDNVEDDDGRVCEWKSLLLRHAADALAAQPGDSIALVSKHQRVRSLELAATTVDARLFELENLIRDADVNAACANKELARSKRIVERWSQVNAKPVMRDCWVGTNAEYEVWFAKWAVAETEAERAALHGLDPNRDLKAAISERTEAVKRWARRKQAVELRSLLAQAKVAADDAEEKYGSLCEEMRSTRAVTMPGLLAKVRVSSGDDLMAQCIIAELKVMAGATPLSLAA